MKFADRGVWHISSIRCAAKLGRCWSNSEHWSKLALNGSVAHDPKALRTCLVLLYTPIAPHKGRDEVQAMMKARRLQLQAAGAGRDRRARQR